VVHNCPSALHCHAVVLKQDVNWLAAAGISVRHRNRRGGHGLGSAFFDAARTRSLLGDDGKSSESLAAAA
jgi:hypothetical protein